MWRQNKANVVETLRYLHFLQKETYTKTYTDKAKSF